MYGERPVVSLGYTVCTAKNTTTCSGSRRRNTPGSRGDPDRRLREQFLEQFSLRRSEMLAEGRLRDADFGGDSLRVGAPWPVEVARVKRHLQGFALSVGSRSSTLVAIFDSDCQSTDW